MREFPRAWIAEVPATFGERWVRLESEVVIKEYNSHKGKSTISEALLINKYPRCSNIYVNLVPILCKFDIYDQWAVIKLIFFKLVTYRNLIDLIFSLYLSFIRQKFYYSNGVCWRVAQVVLFHKFFLAYSSISTLQLFFHIKNYFENDPLRGSPNIQLKVARSSFRTQSNINGSIFAKRKVLQSVWQSFEYASGSFSSLIAF